MLLKIFPELVEKLMEMSPFYEKKEVKLKGPYSEK